MKLFTEGALALHIQEVRVECHEPNSIAPFSLLIELNLNGQERGYQSLNLTGLERADLEKIHAAIDTALRGCVEELAPAGALDFPF